MDARRSNSLLVSEEPDRARLRELQAALDALLDTIAGLEMELDGSRTQFAQFEREYESRLYVERVALTRVHGVLRQLERWTRLLDKCRPVDLTSRAVVLDAQREREIRRLEEEKRHREKELT